MTHLSPSLSLALFGLLVAGHALSCTTSSVHDSEPVTARSDVFEQARGWLGEGTQQAASALCGASALVAPQETVGPFTVRRCTALEAPWRVEFVSRGAKVELIAVSQEAKDTQAVTLPSPLAWCAEPQARLDDSTVWRGCGAPVFVAATGRVLLARPGQRWFVALATSDQALEFFYSSIGRSLR